MKKPGRPANWPNQIDAPEEALELYRLIARLQHSKAFNHCHTFLGTTIGNIPHVRWEGKVTNLPKLICSFVGLEYKKKQCKVYSCLNAFHYTNYDEYPSTGALLEPITVPKPDLSAYVETLKYYIEENNLVKPSLEDLRAIIPVEDISDDLLQQALKELNHEKPI